MFNNVQLTVGKLKGFSLPQYQILIDGILLNDRLNELTGSKEFDLLVPPLELLDEKDQRETLRRLALYNTRMPLLVCPDDMDFSCIVVSALVELQKDAVVWKDFAFGLTELQYIHKPSFKFQKTEYEKFIKTFEDFAKTPFSQFYQDI